MKNIIFLDLDGVLNTFETPVNTSIPTQEWTPAIMKMYGLKLEIHPGLADRIGSILYDIPDTGIVLTSTWRLEDFESVKRFVEQYLVPGDIVDKTPYLRWESRGAEIQAWLKDHPEVINFVIFDDSNLESFKGLDKHFVHVDHRQGVSIDNTDKARLILKLK